MKKILLALLVLIIAVPAMGTVKVKITRVTGQPGKVNIGYTWVTPGEKLRALGLQVTVSKAAYVVGSATRIGTDYYVTPTNITFTTVGGNTVIDQLGLPVVSETTGGCVLEVASLYDPCDPAHPSAPPNDANVVQLGLDCTKVTGSFGTVDVSISATTPAALLRGGIVLEDGNSVTPIIAPSTYMPPKLSFCRTTHPCWLCSGQPSGDADGSGSVGSLDYAALKKAYNTTSAGNVHGTGQGQYNCCADFDHSGSVGSLDYAVLKANYNRTTIGICPATAPAGSPAKTCP